MDSVAIVGASAAGWTAAQSLRDGGFQGRISLIGDEAGIACDRPPLSKRLVNCADAEVARALVERQALLDLNLDCRFGVTATGVSLEHKTVSLDSGDSVQWDALIIATGATPIRLPGEALTLRSFGDALQMGSRMKEAERVIVVGSGVLGCELAALAISHGKSVHMISMLSAPMFDRVGAPVARRLLALHLAHGVQIHAGPSVTEVLDGRAQGTGVRLDDGTTLHADLVLVAIGARPAVDWLAGSEIPLSDGVMCDSHCRAMPDVYAAGDVANWFNPRFGRRMRIEHRTNASEQAMAVAETLLGSPRPFDPIPYFWTDQYDVKIQVHGIVAGNMQTLALLGDPEGGPFVLAYLEGDKIQGVLGWNMPRETLKARKRIGEVIDRGRS